MRTSWSFLLVLLLAAIAVAKEKPRSYQPGTITGWTNQPYASGPYFGHPVQYAKTYELKGAGTFYQIDNCASFKAGQAVEYRVEGNKIYIRREKGKEYKCRIEGTKAAL